jgi:HEAT repeat protein
MDGTVPTRRVLGGMARMVLAAILAAQAGCSQFIGTTAQSFLMKIRDSPDPNVRYAAYSRLASPQCYDDASQKAEAVRILIKKLDGSQEPVATRAVICRTLGELRDPAAREALIKASGDPEGTVRVQACRSLGKVGISEDATILARVMTVDTLEDCRIAAIEGLGELKSKDTRIVQILVAGMEHDDPAIRLASLKALRSITGLDRGVDPVAWRDAVLPKTKTAAASPATASASAPAAAPALVTAPVEAPVPAPATTRR